MPLKQRWKRQIMIATILCCVLMGVYALSYRGVPISDDEELFASVARNVAVVGEWRASQMYGNTRLNGQYDNPGPLHIIIGSLLYRIVEPSNLGGIQVLFLTTPIFTATTAVLLFLFARQLKFSDGAGVSAALIFGFGTIAWPYSQTFYREPLATLFLLGAWFCFIIANNEKTSPRFRWFFWGLFGILYVAVLFTEIVLIVILPIFILFALHRLFRTTLVAQKWHWLPITLLVFLAAGVIWGLLNGQIDFYRFSTSFMRREIFTRIINAPHSNFAEALVGSLISPGKGLFIISPVLLLSVVSLFKYWREQKGIMLIPWTSLLILVIVRALTFDAEWWDMTWGTRFLLPVIPLLVVSTMPLLHNLFLSRNKKLWLSIGFLISFSVLLQISNILGNPQFHNSFLYRHLSQPYSGTAIWDWRYSPLIRNWMALFLGHWDLAIKFSYQASPLLTSLFVFLAVGLVGIAGFALWDRLARKSDDRMIMPKIVFLIAVIVLLPLIMLHTFRSDSRYYAQRTDLVTANKFLSENVQPDEVVVVKAYLYPSWQHLMNFGRMQSIWYSLPLNIQSNLAIENGQKIDIATLKLFDEFAHSNQAHLWFLTEDPEITLEEIYLRNHFTRLHTWEFFGVSQVRISKYSNP